MFEIVRCCGFEITFAKRDSLARTVAMSAFEYSGLKGAFVARGQLCECLQKLFYRDLFWFVFDGNQLLFPFFFDVEISYAFDLFESTFHLADALVTLISAFRNHLMTIYFEWTFLRHSFQCSLFFFRISNPGFTHT